MKISIKNTKNTIIRIVLILEVMLVTILGIVNYTVKKEKISKLTQEERQAMEYEQMTDEDSKIDGTDYVRFNAFFLRDLDNDGYAEKYNGTCKRINEKDFLYMDLNVLTNGYLKNGRIEINGTNFSLTTNLPKDNQIKNNVIGTNISSIELNDINNGTVKTIIGTINSDLGNNINNYSRNDNKVILTGTHVSDEGVETPIRKEVNLTTDWHGDISAYIYSKATSKDMDSAINEYNKTFEVIVDTGIEEGKDELLLSKSHIEGTIPTLNGFEPIDVEIQDWNQTTSTYDEETRKFVVEKIATVEDNGYISSNAYTSSDNNYSTGKIINRKNTIRISIKYPLDAYLAVGGDTVEIQIPISGYFEGFNNPNEEFENPRISNIANSLVRIRYTRPRGYVAIFKVYTGELHSSPVYRYVVSKEKPLNIYNNISSEEKDDIYTVRWEGYTGPQGNTQKMIMKETPYDQEQLSDNFIKNDLSTESMENLTTNIGFYFNNAPVSLLGIDGKVYLYNDETDELIKTFTSKDWSTYNSENPYMYEDSIKHIRIETSETRINGEIFVTNIKELDDEYITTNYTREKFNSLSFINSHLAGYVDNTLINTAQHEAYYDGPFSYASIYFESKKGVVSTQKTATNEKIIIKANVDNIKDEKEWLNGTFLVKIPEEVINFKVNDVKISTNDVTITSYETYEENGIKFIKIYTSNEEPVGTYEITIDSDITCDPRIESVLKEVELYAKNENYENYYYTSDDIYDIDSDDNMQEQVNKTKTTISFVAPNSLLTNQIARNYDNTGNICIAPNIVYTSKEEKTATIDLNLKNNYSNSISEVKVLGRVPKEGNKYVINQHEMDSTFDSYMTEDGIQLPETLRNIVKVYYSEKAEATNDLEDTNNGWTQEVTDWTKIKSYLIDFEDYELTQTEEITLSYDIKIPGNIDYNEITYNNYAVYFSLNTEEGKLEQETEPNKLGFMIARLYDINLTKYQEDSEKKIQGARYKVTEEGQSESKTQMTNTNGQLIIKDLLLAKTYIIQEIKTPEQYELNQDAIKFTTQEDDETGEIKVTLLEGNLRKETTITTNTTNIYIQVEDKIKPNLKIIKYNKENDETIENVKYLMKGKGLGAAGKIVTTNEEGIGEKRGLFLDEEYTLKEVKAEGYYLNEDTIKFKIVNNNGVYSIEGLEGNLKDSRLEIIDEIPTVILEIEDEQKPVYNLQIVKTEKGNKENLLEGAKFKLLKDNDEIATLTTNSEGIIDFNNLYLYNEEKNNQEEGVYRLKEILSPEGYIRAPEYTFRAQINPETNELELKQDYEENKNQYEYEVENNTIKLYFENNPTFKLTKIDGQTQESLPNTKFVIHDITNGQEEIAYDTKNNIVGELENIEGRDYYVVTTDENGEIKKDLRQGKYKLVEVQPSNEKYELADDYYFSIGMAEEIFENYIAEEFPMIDIENTGTTIEWDIIKTNDEGFLICYSVRPSITEIPGTVVLAGETFNITNQSYILLKYDENFMFEWIKKSEYSVQVQNPINNNFYTYNRNDNNIIIIDENGNYVSEIITESPINKIEKTNEGGIISASLVSKEGDFCIQLTKYNINNEIEWGIEKRKVPLWGRDLGFIKELDNGNIVLAADMYGNKPFDFAGEYFEPVDNDYYYGGSLFIWDKDGNELKYWHFYNDYYAQAIEIKSTKDGGFLLLGKHETEISINNEITLKKQADIDPQVYRSYEEMFLMKVSANNEIEKLTNVPTGYYEQLSRGRAVQNTVVSRSFEFLEDGRVIVVGWFRFSSYNQFDILILDQNLENPKYYASNVSSISWSWNESKKVIKINNRYLYKISNKLYEIKFKTVDYAKIKSVNTIGKEGDQNGYDIINTKDGGYIVTGFNDNSQAITLGEETINSKDGYIIKYNEKNEIEKITSIPSENFFKIVEGEDNNYYTFSYNNNSNKYYITKLDNELTIETKNTIDVTANISYYEKNYTRWKIFHKENDIILVLNNVILRTDLEGNIKWRINVESGKTIYTSNIDNNNNIITVIDNTIKKYDLEGNIIFEEETDKNIRGIIYTKDGGCIYINALRDSSYYPEYYIEKRDSNNNTIFESTNLQKISAVIETKEGNISIVGTSDGSIIKNYFEGILDEYFQEGYVLTLDKIGNLVYLKFINTMGQGTDNTFGGIELKNGNIIVAEENYSRYVYTPEYVAPEENYYQGLVLAEVEHVHSIEENADITINNNIKKYNITTEIEEINGIKGGSISGEDRKPYEKVYYKEDSEKPIIMTPDPAYEIVRIRINDEDIEFTPEEDGTYQLPQFENVTEDKHVIVTYAKKTNKLVINKIDSETGENITGATFKIDQIEEREEILKEEVFGEKIDNGDIIPNVDKSSGEIDNVIADLINDETYYFERNGDAYIPNNNKRYTSAISIIPVNLEEKIGAYTLEINLTKRQGTIFEAGIRENNKNIIKTYIKSDDTATNKDYYITIEGGKNYQFYIENYINKAITENALTINSIKVYQNRNSNKYGFRKENGKYISTNKNHNNTLCSSYIPIDLSNKYGTYKLTVNAEIATSSSDGFCYISETPENDEFSNRFVNLDYRNTSARDYSIEITAGKIYYLHMCYQKANSEYSVTNDTFTINSINIENTDTYLNHQTISTNDFGQAITTIPYGKYEITETIAPKGYVLPDEPIIVELREGQEQPCEITIENSKGTNLIINKTDSETNEPLEGVEFEVKEYGITNLYSGEFNTKPENKIEYNGTYYQMNDYHFPPNEEGKYVSNNQGINGSIAKGMVYSSNLVQIPNFTNGSYILEIDAEISSEEGHDFGYINITEGSPISGTDYSQNCIAKISGEQPLKKYYKVMNIESVGYPVFINFAYIKDDNGIDGGEDTFKINSINFYKTEETEGFKWKDGKIQSTNKEKAISQDLSNILLDFTRTEFLNKTIDVEIDYTISSEENKDKAIIKYGTIGVPYNACTTLLTTSGQESNTVSFSLNQNAPTNLYLSYTKDEENDVGDDCFTIDDIRVLCEGKEYFEQKSITNSNGQADFTLYRNNYSNKYTLIEKPLEGYEPIKPIQFTLENGEIETLNIENTKLRNIIVHHYLKDEEGNYTQTKVAEDEKYEGKLGEEYRTKPHIDLEHYELEKDNEGNYIVPVNAIGNFAQETQEINYYYEAKDIPLTVHHYIRGTSEKVPLSDGTKARDEEYTGKENEEYRTNALTKEQLSEQYELVETPDNAEGTYEYPGVDVTYFYDEVERDVVIKKVDEDGETPIEGVKFKVVINGEEKEYITDENGEFELRLKYGVYELEEKETPEGYISLENPIEIGITKDTEEGQIIKITNAKEKGNVIVHHYLKGTTTKVPSKTFDETGDRNDVVEDETKRGIIGNPFATKPNENVSNIYKHVSNTKPKSGQYKRETQEIIYYYDLNLPNILVDIKVNKTWRDENANQRPEQIKFKLYKADQNGKPITTDEEQNEIAPIDEKTMSSQSTSVTFNNIHKYDENNEIIKYTIIEEMIGEKGKQYKYEVGTLNEVEETNKLQEQYGYEVEITNYQVIKDLEITKTGTNSITSLSDTIRYNITYKAKIDKSYNGIVNIKITDNLPYKIDTSKAYNLKGGEYNESTKKIEWSGTYNKETHKITWSNGEEETVGNEQQDDKMWIDTNSSSVFDIFNLNKNISLTFKNIPYNAENFENNVKGRVEIDTQGYIEKEANKETTTNFKVNITAKKIWKGDTNNLDGRPNSITITLYVKEQDNEGRQRLVKALDEQGEEITAEIKAQDNWEYTFNNLPKYNNRSEEIKYTAQEEEPEGYYNSSIEDNEEEGIILITNNKYGSITITKVDKNTGERLTGAKFTIEKLTQENQIDETFAKQEKETSNEETNKGDVTFDNLKYGKYRITEIKAPEGYNLSILPIEIEITEENPDKQELFTNRSKELLPAAGGSMKEFIQVITIYTEVGALAIMLGILINKKKKAMK